MRLSKKLEHVALAIGAMELECENCEFQQQCGPCVIDDVIAAAVCELREHENKRLEDAKKLKKFMEKQNADDEKQKKKTIQYLENIINEYEENV